MTNLIAIAPKGGRIKTNLTNGKGYPIISWHKKTYQRQDWFYITDDNGNELYCVPEYDFYLNRLNWTIRRMTIFERIKYFFV